MAWWYLEAKMWDRDAGARRRDGGKVNEKSAWFNAGRVSLEKVLEWLGEWQAEGWVR